MNSKNHSHFELSPIKAIELEASKMDRVISLAQGIPSFPTPQPIKDYAAEMMQRGLCDKYSLTIGLTELREEISISLSAEEGLSYDPDREILCTVGSIHRRDHGVPARRNKARRRGHSALSYLCFLPRWNLDGSVQASVRGS